MKLNSASEHMVEALKVKKELDEKKEEETKVTLKEGYS